MKQSLLRHWTLDNKTKWSLRNKNKQGEFHTCPFNGLRRVYKPNWRQKQVVSLRWEDITGNLKVKMAVICRKEYWRRVSWTENSEYPQRIPLKSSTEYTSACGREVTTHPRPGRKTHLKGLGNSIQHWHRMRIVPAATNQTRKPNNSKDVGQSTQKGFAYVVGQN